jgi:hypothetical protein
MLLADHYNRKSSLRICLMNGATVMRVSIYAKQSAKFLRINSPLITGRFDVNMTFLLRVTRYVSPFLQTIKALKESTGIALICF